MYSEKVYAIQRTGSLQGLYYFIDFRVFHKGGRDAVLTRPVADSIWNNIFPSTT